MVDVNKILDIAYSALLGSTQTYNATASVNGVLISLQASYSGGVLTLQGSVTLQVQSNTLQVELYIGDYLVDSFVSNVILSPGTYTFVYTLALSDSTGIISNAFGYAVTNQLKSVSITTNTSSYVISLTQNMLTFYLAYTSYPSTISISVTFTLTSGSTVTGSYSNTVPSLPQGVQLYGAVIPVTFEL